MTSKKTSTPAVFTLFFCFALPRLCVVSLNFEEGSTAKNGSENGIFENLTSSGGGSIIPRDDSVVLDRTAKALTLPINSRYENMRKSDTYDDKNSSSGSLNPPLNGNGNERNLSSIDEATSLAFQKMVNNKRPSSHRKYPTHYTLYRTVAEEHPNDKAPVRTYSIRDDNEYQSQNYESDYHPHKYDYEDNSIPEDQINYEEVLSDPWRVSYIDHNAGYYGPPQYAAGHHNADPHVLSLSPECSCPRQSFDCDPGPTSSFTFLLASLGRTLWALLQLIAATVAPILIPLLAVKMVLVPIKIFTILKLLKLFIKFFIILPFFVRVLYPALTSSFSWANFFAALQALIPGSGGFRPQRPLLAPLRPLAANDQLGLADDSVADDEDESDLESRHESSSDDDISNGEVDLEEDSAWDLRACPSRVACELGAFLSGSVKHNLLENLIVQLGRKIEAGKDDLEDEDEFFRKHETFKAFLIALTGGWSFDKCQMYKCSVLF